MLGALACLPCFGGRAERQEGGLSAPAAPPPGPTAGRQTLVGGAAPEAPCLAPWKTSAVFGCTQPSNCASCPCCRGLPARHRAHKSLSRFVLRTDYRVVGRCLVSAYLLR